ncbi:hypothetical protein L1987_55395 [Smallanthus sonchifolius]|uniref:Uncharacterized protein n=1 Tax=Smallanthus sonchifolius TaxID=185202 RepID=A0ACB9EAW0_9ASTR|nr:hypothetical protein L1987_55395 [Smallanthus sonchifolius]
MIRRIRNQSAATKPENSYFRFLKPGALAQLRDSKINARFHLRSPESQICLHRATPSSPTSASRSLNTSGIIQQQQQDVTGNLTTTDAELPFLSARFYAPRCLKRKKLMAVRSMCYLNHNSSSLTSDGPVPAIDAL